MKRRVVPVPTFRGRLVLEIKMDDEGEWTADIHSSTIAERDIRVIEPRLLRAGLTALACFLVNEHGADLADLAAGLVATEGGQWEEEERGARRAIVPESDGGPTLQG